MSVSRTGITWSARPIQVLTYRVRSRWLLVSGLCCDLVSNGQLILSCRPSVPRWRVQSLEGSSLVSLRSFCYRRFLHSLHCSLPNESAVQEFIWKSTPSLPDSSHKCLVSLSFVNGSRKIKFIWIVVFYSIVFAGRCTCLSLVCWTVVTILLMSLLELFLDSQSRSLSSNSPWKKTACKNEELGLKN